MFKINVTYIICCISSSVHSNSCDCLSVVSRPVREYFTLSRQGSLSCHTKFDTGPRFPRSHPEDRLSGSPRTTRHGYWRYILTWIRDNLWTYIQIILIFIISHGRLDRLDRYRDRRENIHGMPNLFFGGFFLVFFFGGGVVCLISFLLFLFPFFRLAKRYLQFVVRQFGARNLSFLRGLDCHGHF
mgnify:CR=1 FL=1